MNTRRQGMAPHDGGAEDPRSGVALIIVLGALALFSMLIVTLSLSMRAERSASANYLRAEQSRGVMHAALARALSDLDTIYAQDMYPTNDVFVPEGAGTLAGEVAPDLLSPAMLEFIPGELHAEALAAEGRARWQRITIGNGQEGWYSYMIVNVSGFLDANVVGGGTNGRALGTNVSELLLNPLPEIYGNHPTDQTVDDAFLANRDDVHLRYESLQELHALQEGATAGGLDDWPQSLYTYSRQRVGYLNRATNVVPRVYIGGNEVELQSRQAEIVAAFDEALGEPLGAEVFELLLDYVDEDSVPRSLASPATETVPMVNELRSLFEVAYNTGNQTLSTYMRGQVEWWFPFVTAASNAFTFDLSVETEVDPNAQSNIAAASSRLLPPSLIQSFPCSYTPGTLVPQPQGQDYAPTDMSEINPNNTYTNLPATNVSFTIEIKVRLRDHNGEIVDSVPSDWDTEDGFIYTLAAAIPTSNVPALVSYTNGWETCDPRFNWMPAAQYLPYEVWGTLDPPLYPDFAGSIGEVNVFVQEWYSNPDLNSGWLDPATNMYVANRPLQQVGELGYLLRGQQANAWWRTVRLFAIDNEPPDQVLDAFTMNDPDPMVQRGLVNPNTRQRDVLATVFYDMPLDEYPGKGDNRLSWTQARQLADDLIAERDTAQFWMVSDIGYLTNLLDTTVLAPRTQFEKEAFLRNSSGLISPRNNAFVIFVAGQLNTGEGTVRYVWVENDAKPLFLGGDPGNKLTTVHGDQRAVAVVWRDPYPFDDHEVIVRHFEKVSR